MLSQMHGPNWVQNEPEWAYGQVICMHFLCSFTSAGAHQKGKNAAPLQVFKRTEY